VGPPDDKRGILAAQEAAFHVKGLLEGLEAPGTEAFPDGLSFHFQIEVRARGQDPQGPAGIPQGFAPLQGKNGSRALQKETFG
jgi:hypothetical protein